MSDWRTSSLSFFADSRSVLVVLVVGQLYLLDTYQPKLRRISGLERRRQRMRQIEVLAEPVAAGFQADREQLVTPLRATRQTGVRTMRPRVRRFVLLVHVLVSVGALGLYVALLTLATAGLETRDPERLRVAYLALGVFSDTLILPVNLAVLATGLLLGLGTHWGLFRY